MPTGKTGRNLLPARAIPKIWLMICDIRSKPFVNLSPLARILLF
jgi:hypothetical protein